MSHVYCRKLFFTQAMIYDDNFATFLKWKLIWLQLSSFRASVVSLLSMDTTCPDYEIIARLSKVMSAYREFSSVSKRYDDPILPHVHPSPRRTPHHSPHSPRRTPRFSPDRKTPRCDDSGFLDPIMDDCDSDLNSLYKRPYRTSWPDDCC